MHHHRRPHNDTNWLGLLIFLLIIGGMSSILVILVPLVIIAGLGWGIYKLVSHQKRLETTKTNLRIADLKENIRQTDLQLQTLDQHLDTGNLDQYANLSHQLLPRLETIQKEADALKNSLDARIYQRVSLKVKQVTNDISHQLGRLEELKAEQALTQEERQIMQLAPEILDTYRRIKRDDQHILEKIKEASNPAELTALHESDMRRFDSILQGYLKIKESPKDYYDAQERLEQAKLAIEQFDKDLDEQLRQLNEDEMHDFEINLRLLTDATRKDKP